MAAYGGLDGTLVGTNRRAYKTWILQPDLSTGEIRA